MNDNICVFYTMSKDPGKINAVHTPDVNFVSIL